MPRRNPQEPGFQRSVWLEEGEGKRTQGEFYLIIFPMDKRFNHREAEERWFKFWEERGYFKPKPSEKGAFVIMMPPPNVTGIIHMGHVLDNTMQDILARWRRMQGYEVLWQPGIDHAGIATQNKVEQALAAEGKTRFDLGREEFLRRVWEWKERFGGIIVKQLRRLGASADWSRLVFTMDPEYSRAVLTAFVRLFEEGLVYRGKRLINWCPRCGTALADDEVERQETRGKLWYIRYPLVDGSDEVVVATTRPETYLGDTAVAVHPDDERYKHLIGKRVRLPLVDWERKDINGKPVPAEIPVVAHRAVDPHFGTGAVKVTPGHDFADWEIGQELELPVVQVLDADARMTENAGPYKGLDRYEARERVVQALREAGYLVKEEPYTVPLGVCYRCGTAIEPLLSEQWFVRMKPLAEPAVRAVKEGRVRIIPEHGEKIFFHWMEGVRDWCVSRQIWWGHRIPVYYCDSCGHTWASVEKPQGCPKCGSTQIRQDEDVLDTWASSWLWPFATLGWPEETQELKKYYPTSVLITGWDILFFWVARMMMAGEHFMGAEPFRFVYLHGLVRDHLGRKFSKSLGNSPDPLELFDKYSVDGVRLGMMLIMPEGKDIRFSERMMAEGRDFTTKLWNAARFLILKSHDLGHQYKGLPEDLELEDLWILHRYDKFIKTITQKLESFDFNEAAWALYHFLWSDFCDWYLEAIKPRLKAGDLRALDVAFTVLEGFLRAAHPFIPFVTEELWQRMPNREGESVMVAPWPEPLGRGSAEAAERFELLKEMVSGVREVRATFNISKKKPLSLVFVGSEEALNLAREKAEVLRALAGVDRVEAASEPPERSSALDSRKFEAYIPLEGVDLDAERRRVEKEIGELEALVAKLERQLANPSFLERAPVHVIEAKSQSLAELKEKLRRLKLQRERLFRF